MKISTAFIYLSGFIIYFCSSTSAQDIQLMSGDHTRKIKAGSFIEINLVSPDQEPCKKCPVKGVRGQLVSFTNGVVNLKLHQTQDPLMDEKNITGNIIKSYKKAYRPIMSYRTEDILSVKKKGMHKIKKYNAGQSVGMALTVIGFGHLISAPFVSDADTHAANTLIGVGVTEMVTGIILGRAFHQKIYYTSEACPQKKPGQKLWVIN